MTRDRERWWAQDFVLEPHGDVTVVREDQIEGGSKMRFLPFLIPENAREVVFGGPFCGGAPLALSVIGRAWSLKTTLFYAQRKELHRRQQLALRNGAHIVQVPFGYMSNVQAKAKAYAQQAGAMFLPLGFDLPAAEEPFIEAMRRCRTRLGFEPDEVWCATGSGMLARCLGQAFPGARICAVAVGLASRWQAQTFPVNVKVAQSPLQFHERSKATAPFDCCPNYERKAWEWCVKWGTGRRLFWNVLGE